MNKKDLTNGPGEEDNHYHCSKCFYSWKKRKSNPPKNCPRCRSTVWMSEYFQKECKRCGHEWGSTREEPARCPSCGSQKWDEPSIELTCKRCQYTWFTKGSSDPKRCPQCKTITWNSEAKKKNAVEKIPTINSKQKLPQDLEEELRVQLQSGKEHMMIAINMNIPFETVHAYSLYFESQ